MSRSAGRESEGLIVPKNAGQHNLREGRSPALFMLFKEVRVSECQTANDTKGKSSTTPRKARSCSQGEQASVNSMHCTTRSIGGMFYAKHGRRVRANKGAAGVDAVTLADIEKQGEDSFLKECQEQVLKEGTTIPSPYGDTTSRRRMGSKDRWAFRP